MGHNPSEVTEAIAQRADADATDGERRTQLIFAVRYGGIAVTVNLIWCGANAKIQDKKIETPLHFAAREYTPGIGALLLKHGASVDSQVAYGKRPPSRATFCARNRGEVIKLLLAHGVDGVERPLRRPHRSGDRPFRMPRRIALPLRA